MDSSRIEKAVLLAERQRGVISADQLNRAGIPNHTIRRLVRSGQLTDLYPGVFRFNGNRLEWLTRVVGAVIWGGDDGLASHRCAARVHELSIKSDVVEITLPKRVRSPGGMKVHYGQIDPIDVRRIDGIPVTSVPRTLLTLGAVVPPSLVERLLDEALIKGKTKPSVLLDVLMRESRQGLRGLATFRRLLNQRMSVPETIRTELERRMNRIFEEESLPPAISQYKINIGDQCFVSDFAYPDLGIVIEADGNEFHLARQAHERDADRQNVLILNGWLVLRFTWYMVTRQSKAVADAIRAAIESRTKGKTEHQEALRSGN